MTILNVWTIAELKKAKEHHTDKIIVEGKLAKYLVNSRKIATLSPASSVALAGGAVVATTVACRLLGHVYVVAPSLLSGVSLPAAIYLHSIGPVHHSLIIALLKEYTMETLTKHPVTVVLSKKSNPS